MKKVFVILVVFSLVNFLSAEDFTLNFLIGRWMPENKLTSNARVQLHYEYFYPNDSSFDFFHFNAKEAEYIGFLKHSGLSFGYLIKSFSKIGEKYLLECYPGSFDQEGNPIIHGKKESVTLSILKEDWIQLEGFSNEKLLEKSNKLYRVEDYKKTPLQRAVVNDSSVRLRTEPSLQSHTLYLLPKNYEVEILDKTEETTEIDGEKWPWYKIRSKYCEDGFIYGKYLDIYEYFIKDEKQITLKYYTFRKNNNIYVFRDSNFYYISDFSLSEDELKSVLKSLDYTKDDFLDVLNKNLPNYYFTKNDYGYTTYSNKEIFKTIYSKLNFLSQSGLYKDKDKIIKSDDKNKKFFVQQDINYNFGIKIGMSKNELLNLLGNPTEIKDNTIIYEAENFRIYIFTFIFDENELLEAYTCTYKLK